MTGELSRYMYETRGAIRFLAKNPKQKAAAEAFFKSIEATADAARLKKKDACADAAAKSISTLDAFVSTV